MHKIDFTNEELLEILKEKSPAFLADVYRQNNNIVKCCDLLKRIYKKEQLLDQISLSYIYLKRFEEAEKFIQNTETKTISRLKITLELQKSIKKIKIRNIDVCKYLSIQEKVFLNMFENIEIVKFIPIGHKINGSIDGSIDDIYENISIDNIYDNISIDDNIVYNVYDYKCGTDKYQNILSSIIEYLLKYFDLNLIFIYYQIVTISCFLNNCSSNCREIGHKTIKKELLDPSYLNILGYKNLCVLYEMYKDSNLLEIMYKLNPFIDEKYKKLYLELYKKEEDKEFIISQDEEIPIEETVLIKDINKPNGIAKMMTEIKEIKKVNKVKRTKKDKNYKRGRGK